MFTNFIRRFNTSKVFWSTESSLLAKLRKKTGYTFANCKKALDMHNNDLDKAELWLHKQAQELGWAKATKLAGRSTGQGLVAVKCNGSHAALVEVNCETDFVARNEKFQNMVQEAVNTCFHHAHTNLQAKGLLTKICFDTEQLGALKTVQGKTLADQLVLMIGSVGENSSLRRAECWKAATGLHLSGYTHPPSSETSAVSAGKYGGILAYITDDDKENTVIGKQLCQHIVGMNPAKIGNEDADERNPNSDEEHCLIYQEFIADPELTVSEVLKENKIRVYDFVRFECGETLQIIKEQIQQPLDTVQTCQ